MDLVKIISSLGIAISLQSCATDGAVAPDGTTTAAPAQSMQYMYRAPSAAAVSAYGLGGR